MIRKNRKAGIRGFLCSIALLMTAACEQKEVSPDGASWEVVRSPWLGAAEICRYELEQERYGELRKGDAVFVFAREPFHKDRQVKDESGTGGGFQVLKLNATRHFLTGIYPYHTMVSVFQPFIADSSGEALKVTTSVQEWCGHVFMQSNRRNGGLKTSVNSYFEKEDGSEFVEERQVWLEDEIWTSLRLDPEGLPVGEVLMIPGSLFTRFAHQDPVAEKAIAQWLPGDREGLLVYQVDYPKTGRVLAIEVERSVPYVIQGWTEGVRGRKMTTARLTHRRENAEYWSENSTSDERLRLDLGLPR